VSGLPRMTFAEVEECVMECESYVLHGGRCPDRDMVGGLITALRQSEGDADRARAAYRRAVNATAFAAGEGLLALRRADG